MAWQDVLKNITNESYNSGNSGLYDSETARANKVIAERKAQGLDVSAQLKYLQQLNEANALGQVKREASSVWADPNNIDMNYVRARMAGNERQYLNDIVSNNGENSPLSGASSPLHRASSQGTASALPDIESKINALKEAGINAKIAALDKAKVGALGAYAGAERSINQNAQAARNANSVTSQRGTLDFAKYLASRGLVNSGAAAQGAIAGNVALQGAQSQVESDKANKLADVANSRARIEEGYQADVAGARAGVESQAMEMAIQEAQRARDLALQQDQFNKQLGLQQQQFGLQSQNQQFNQRMAEKQFEESIRQNNLSQSNWQQQFTYQQAQDKIQNMMQQGQLSVQQANVALSQARQRAEQDQNSLDNQIRRAQLAQINAETAQIGNNDAELRQRAAAMASQYGTFDPAMYEQIYNALKNGTSIPSNQTTSETPWYLR